MSVRKRQVVGLNAKSVIAALAVLVVASLILTSLNRLVVDRGKESEDIQKMRRIYVALTIYETSNNDLPPPDLRYVTRYLGGTSDFLASNDPFAAGNAFPLDPALPSSRTSKIRVSFSYLPEWISHGGWNTKNWSQDVDKPSLGLISCYWYGDIDNINPDGRLCTGPVIRANMDGSISTVPRSNHEKLTVDDLFLKSPRS